MFHTKNYRELNRLFFMFVIPAVSSQLLSGIYTIVDGYFVGWGIGQGGLAAIGLSFPFSVIVTAIGAGIGVGGNLVNKDWITQGQWDKITLLAKELCASVNV